MNRSIERTLDSVILVLVARRLGRFRRLRDAGDEFADAVVKLMGAEMERRNRLYAGWDAEFRQAEAAEADARRTRIAAEQFEQVSCPADRARLQ